MCENIQAAKDCFDGMIDRLKQSLSAKVKAVFMPHPSDRADARASLASVIKDWCDSLDQGAFESSIHRRNKQVPWTVQNDY